MSGGTPPAADGNGGGPSQGVPPPGGGSQPGGPAQPAASRPLGTSATPRRPLVRHSRLAEPLRNPQSLQEMGLPSQPGDLIPVVVELNVRYDGGISGADRQFRDVYAKVVPDPARPPSAAIATIYVHCRLTSREQQQLLDEDDAVAVQGAADVAAIQRRRAIFRIWPDFPVRPLVDRSCATIKADAARRTFGATGFGITWAVVDSGIDGAHPHFATCCTLGGEAVGLHRDFTQPQSDGTAAQALTDAFGHGTHVAGIIAGVAPDGRQLQIVQHAQDAAGGDVAEERTLPPGAQLAGIAPMCKLISLKVLDGQGQGATSNVLRALAYVREELNGNGKLPRVHGVNLSLGYEFDPKWFACGQSPLCAEVDRLVRSGVVVVVAAGNTGYGTQLANERQTATGLGMTINDPGNADLAITVGATHRDQPHVYGVSYFSSKGPTGDGRAKPDLVAPGERITSCAAGQFKAGMSGDPSVACYVDNTGTSVAAPHVSGAIAAFLSIRGEYVNRPEEVKRIFLGSATSLGREPYFEGHGLVDLMRAIQSV